MTTVLMMRLEKMNTGRGDDVACSGGTTAEMNVDSRGYVNIQAAEVRSEMNVDSGDYFTWQRRIHLDP